MNNPSEATPSTSNPAKKKSWLMRLLDLFFLVCLAGLIVATICGFAGTATWWLDLFSHFPIQYATAAIPTALWFLIRRRPVALFLAAGILVINGFLVYPLFVKPASPFASTADVAVANKAKDADDDTDADAVADTVEDTVTPETVRILCANVYVGNSKSEGLLKLIEDEQPEIVIVQEFTTNWGKMLEGLDDDYPHSLKLPNNGAFGIALYSSIRLDRLIPWNPDGKATPGIIARFRKNGRSMTLMTSHPVPPTSEDYSNQRNKQILAIGIVANATEGAFALCGDLNMTRWSPWFKELTSAGLTDAAEGFGLQTSWPNVGQNRPSIFRIPIDHCLVSKEVGVKDFRVGSSTNSDHLPIIVDLEF